MGNSGIGHVTRKDRNIWIAREQRDWNCKIGEGGGLACEKLQKNLSENSSYLTSTLRDPIREEANAGTHNECNTYYYGRRIGMIKMICMAWQRWCDATIQFKRDRKPDTQILGSSYLSTPPIKFCLTWHKHGMGALRKIKWNRDKITIPHNSIFSY